MWQRERERERERERNRERYQDSILPTLLQLVELPWVGRSLRGRLNYNPIQISNHHKRRKERERKRNRH